MNVQDTEFVLIFKDGKYILEKMHRKILKLAQVSKDASTMRRIPKKRQRVNHGGMPGPAQMPGDRSMFQNKRRKMVRSSTKVLDVTNDKRHLKRPKVKQCKIKAERKNSNQAHVKVKRDNQNQMHVKVRRNNHNERHAQMKRTPDVQRKSTPPEKRKQKHNLSTSSSKAKDLIVISSSASRSPETQSNESGGLSEDWAVLQNELDEAVSSQEPTGHQDAPAAVNMLKA